MTWVCSHYRCPRTDVAPVAYWVLGSEFIRILCPDHQPGRQGWSGDARQEAA